MCPLGPLCLFGPLCPMDNIHTIASFANVVLLSGPLYIINGPNSQRTQRDVHWSWTSIFPIGTNHNKHTSRTFTCLHVVPFTHLLLRHPAPEKRSRRSRPTKLFILQLLLYTIQATIEEKSGFVANLILT